MAKPPTAGYSGTPLPQKLGIKPDHLLAILNGPVGFSRTLGELPPGVTLVNDLPKKTRCDVILYFTRSRADYEDHFDKLKKALSYGGGLWICWPKKASKVATDMTEDVVRAVALSGGLVDNKVCAVDATWSGLRLVYRLKDRPAQNKANG